MLQPHNISDCFLNRLVSSEMDKVQEEMAWQMAGMFVEEITSITSPESKKSNTAAAASSIADECSHSATTSGLLPDDDDSIKDASIASSYAS